MNFINLESNRGLVNLLSDYIMLEINDGEKYDTVIEVTDFGRFFVVNGMTSRKEVVNLNEVTTKFKKDFDKLLNDLNYKDINVIDLIIYGNDLTKKEEFWFTFYNTKRPSYSNDMLTFLYSDLKNLKYQRLSNYDVFSVELDFSENNTNDLSVFTYSPLNITSEFPHGYSYNMGRNHYYYSEYICNHLFSYIMTEQIHFKTSTIKNGEDDFNIEVITNSIYGKDKIISLVLDVFDFNLNKFKSKLSEYNYLEDIKNPLGDKPWLVKDNSKNIIIF